VTRHDRTRTLKRLAGSAILMAGLTPALPAASDEGGLADWLSENFEVHGFLRSRYYMRVPDWENSAEATSLRTELNLESELRLFQQDEWSVGFYSVVQPVYEAVYDFNGDLYGRNVDRATFNTAQAFPNNQTATQSGNGDRLFAPATGVTTGASGGRLEGEFTIVNADTGSLFSGELIPAVSIDDVVFFGRVTAPVAARGRQQTRIGGYADGTTYEQLRDNFGKLLVPGGIPNAGLPLGAGLDASLGLASQPLTTALNFYAGADGNASSLEHGSFDVNRRESDLKFDCNDNAHPYCFFREFYFDVEWKHTFFRLGRQQIVWGKTDAFRLQDTINPIDFGYHNVFPSLEDRRIPVLALDAIQSFGEVGPLDDVSLEFAWVWDRFIPDQFGQCGEPWAFTAACEGRADAGGHQLFNFSLSGVDERHWKFRNTQPGVRLEFRTPEPSIAFSLSAFYGFQKTPVARFSNFYSVENPNAAVMLFLQGITDGTGTPLAGIIDALSQGAEGVGPLPPSVPAAYSGTPGTPGTGVWITGFDPYSRTGPTPTGTLADANDDLHRAWFMLTNVLPPAGGGCAGLSGSALSGCGAAIAAFGLPWSASEAELEYPRIWSIGGSLDYQIPGIDTVLRAELAADLDRRIQNTDKLDQVTQSHVFKAAIGLDRSTFIPFLNRNRTAFISAQTFVEHITDYDDGRFGDDGMVPYETNVISTLFMENYWRNDSIILTNLFAIDWKASAIVWGPQLGWVYNESLRFDAGVNALWGESARHNLRDVCADATLSCLGDPTAWQSGNWQMLNGPLVRQAEAPFWGQESFADKFMRRRDEVWVGATYQF
jgi:hypothetical protein